MSVRVKICGITSRADAQQAVRAGADAIGVVFAPSRRRVTPAEAARIASAVGPLVAVIGVFVNPTIEEVERALRRCRLSAVQLHGNESPSLVRTVARLAPVIKAVRLASTADLRLARMFRGVEAFLCDSLAPGEWGGSGRRGNWELAAALRRSGVRLILAGGLTPGNVAAAIRAVRPYGVDVSSGVERAPGRKHPALVQAFIDRAKRTSIHDA